MSEAPAPVPETPVEPAPEEARAEPSAERQTTPFLVLQFFIFPLAIVAVCVTVFVVFGLIASEGRGAREYLDEIRTGGANRRWQAAFELSKVLQARRDAPPDPRLAPEMISLFEASQQDDPRVRRYLALALGRLGDPRAVPALRKLAAAATPDADVESVIYAVWALGSIGDPSAVPDLVRLAGSPERDVRKAAVHALGVFPGEESGQALGAALGDAVPDVRWNAALALARRADPAATPVLAEMLDRQRVASAPGITPSQQDEAIERAIVEAGRLSDPALRAAIAVLEASDPSPAVREAARRALGAPPAPDSPAPAKR